MSDTVNLTPDGGVTKRILVVGTGPQPPKGREVRVHYVGTFHDGPNVGQVFDSSRKKGREFKFPLGQGRVISGWDLGVASMNKGEKCVLVCKAAYAYGDRGAGDIIPPGATLEFEVELFGWEGDEPASPKCQLA